MFRKRKGSALVTTAIVSSMFVGLMAFAFAKVWTSNMADNHNSRITTQAAIYCDDRIEILKGTIYSYLPTTTVNYPVGNGYNEQIEPLGNGQFKVSVFYGGETLPRASKVLERTPLGRLNYNITNTSDDADRFKAFTQKLATDYLADKEHYVATDKDVNGNIIQAGDNKTPVYIKADGKAAAVDFSFRARNLGAAGPNTKIPVTDGQAIDFIYMSDLLAMGIKEQNYSREQGYVIFGNNMVFAYKNFYSAVSSGQLAEVQKPTSFTTYQAMGSDTSRGNEKTTARIVWQAQNSNADADFFRLDSNGNSTVKEYFSVFWIGMK